MKFLQLSLKYNLIREASDIYAIKSGQIYKFDNECYVAAKWFSVLCNIFWYSGIIFFGLFFLYAYLMAFVNVWWISLILSLGVYFLFEIILAAVVPLRKVKCWEKSLQEQKRRESKWYQ